MSGRIEGRVAIVTGGAQGIGGAIARRFVAEGAQVVIADILEDVGQALAAELGSAAQFVRTDVTDAEAWNGLIAAAEALGGLDILVNNVGGAPARRNLVEADLAYHRLVMDLNVTSTWAGMRAAIPAMRARGGGSIVNISSIDGLAGVAGLSSYVAGKFAVTGMTKSIALEVGAYGIRVNSVHPGVIATPLSMSGGEASKKAMNALVAPQPIPRVGEASEVAAAVLFFASDESSYCTGSSLVVDGGHLAGPTRNASH